LGSNEAAQQAYQTVVQNYSDQTGAYQDANARLREMTARESRAVAVQNSTPTVVYQTPRTRLEVLLLNLWYNPARTTVTTEYPSVSYFYKTGHAIGFEAGQVEERANNDYATSSTKEWLHSTYVGLTYRREWEMANQIHPFLKAGGAALRFERTGNVSESDRWTPGLMTEAGLMVGWSRGLA